MLVIYSLLLFFTSYATTFAPTPAVKQIEFAEYIIHGTVIDQTVQTEPRSNQPYTYWTLRIDQVIKGENLDSSEVVIRQPGGELNGIGYRVAGSAQISMGENILVTVRDTNENQVKEIVSLAMGKYRVEYVDGKPALKNGLGFYLKNADGSRMSLNQFAALVDRVKRGQTRNSDKKIILLPEKHTITHNHSHNRTTNSSKNSKKNQIDSHQGDHHKKNTLELQKPGKAADMQGRPQSESKWPYPVKIILALAVGFIFYLLYRLFRN